MEGGKVHKTNSDKVKEIVSNKKASDNKTSDNKVSNKKASDNKASKKMPGETFISNETTKEIVRLLTNDLKEYSKFINDTFPVKTTTMHVNKPISYYLGKS